MTGLLIQADAFYLPYADKIFHMIITSPPYWGLRKYAGDQGDDPLGLESTPERHIERMVEVFREVRRVLRDDGVVYLNYGDCYAGSGKGAANYPGDYPKQNSNTGSLSQDGVPTYKGIAAGNLMLMPHRLAIALQEDGARDAKAMRVIARVIAEIEGQYNNSIPDRVRVVLEGLEKEYSEAHEGGWIVRQDLVWHKPNPMPESLAGWRWEKGKLRKSSWRHTRAHEYVFMMVKKMGYYCDQEAVREITGSEMSSDEYEQRTAKGATWKSGGIYLNAGAHKPDGGKLHPSGRNPRDVLAVPTAPYKGAHYATFPPQLIAPLIRASCPRRACPECGQAWSPVVAKTFVGTWHDHSQNLEKGARQDSGGPASEFERPTVKGHRPTCDHYPDILTIEIPDGIHPSKEDEYRCFYMDENWPHVPGKVLDIFGGSGTVGMVARELLLDWVVMDLSRPYLDEQAKIRTKTGTPSKSQNDLPLFNGEPY